MEPFALAAENQCLGLGWRCRRKQSLRPMIQSDDPEPLPAGFRQGLNQVADPYDGDGKGGTCRDPDHGPCHRGSAAAGDHDPGNSGRCGSPKNRAEIVRVGDAIQIDEQTLSADPREDVGVIGVLEPSRSCDPLRPGPAEALALGFPDTADGNPGRPGLVGNLLGPPSGRGCEEYSFDRGAPGKQCANRVGPADYEPIIAASVVSDVGTPSVTALACHYGSI